MSLLFLQSMNEGCGFVWLLTLSSSCLVELVVGCFWCFVCLFLFLHNQVSREVGMSELLNLRSLCFLDLNVKYLVWSRKGKKKKNSLRPLCLIFFPFFKSSSTCLTSGLSFFIQRHHFSELFMIKKPVFFGLVVLDNLIGIYSPSFVFMCI